MPSAEARRHRVQTEQLLTPGTEITLEPGAAKHLLQVLRLRQGDQITLFDGQGQDYSAEITRIRGNALSARVGAPGPPEPPATLRIHLGLGISKGERMDFAIQKAVELGVTEITPLWTARSVVKLDDARLSRKVARWQGILIAACEQSGRRRLPALHPPEKLPSWLTPRHACGLMLDHRATATLHQLAPPADHHLSLVVGPEGGLTPDERQAAETAGFTAVRLGPRILRTETAPLAAIAAIQTLWGDFQFP
jgi:16S rRNA (uracil1498-N3)-methyltransferase